MLTLCAIQWAELRRLVGQMWPSAASLTALGIATIQDSYSLSGEVFTKQSTVYEQKQNNK